jgi:DNA topoisomerase IB
MPARKRGSEWPPRRSRGGQGRAAAAAATAARPAAGAITLYPHQARVVRRIVGGTRGLLCVHSTGSGKTLLSAACIRELLRLGRVGRAAVVARKSAVQQFRDEVLRFAPEVAGRVFVGTHRAVIAWLGGSGGSRSRHSPARSVAGGPPLLLVVDEAHEYVNTGSAGYRQLRPWADRAAHVLLLTATPIVNSAFDLAVLTSLAKGVPLPDRGDFFGRVLGVPVVPAGREWAEARPLSARRPPPEFARWFAGAVDVHLVDKDADPRFPRMVTRVVRLPMAAKTRAAYAAALDKPAPFYANLRKLSLGAGAGRGGCEKCAWLTKHAKQWVADGDGKIVVYSSFLEHGARRIREALVRAGLNVLAIDGSSSAADRRRATLMFNRRAEEEPREELHRDLRQLVAAGRSKTASSSSPAGTNPAWGCGKLGVAVTRLSTKQPDGSYRFEYRQGEGEHGPPATAEQRAYVDSLVIPPPWSPAYVCAPNPKLLWVGRDLTGKWQYRYSRDWNDQQEYRKILRLRDLDKAFWRRFRAQLDRDVAAGRARGATPQQVRTALAAVAVRLMSQCHFRVGQEGTTSRAKKQKAAKGTSSRSASSGGTEPGGGGDSGEATYGVTTLLKRHVALRAGAGAGSKSRTTSKARPCGAGARITFRGKSGQTNVCAVRDGRLLSELRWLMRRVPADKELFGRELRAEHVRAYLDRLRPGLRPKDFRTYFANLTLVRHLAAGPDPTRLKASQRARRLAEAYAIAARGLNNTPRMAKSSYVFTGLWVLYLADPTRFRAVVAEGKKRSGSAAGSSSSSPADLLDRFIALFEHNKIDWRYMLQWYRETGGVSPFMGPAQVLLITDAGSESIDLAGTRHLVFLDATWTPALEEQIVGRGRRFGSHQHLAPEKRALNVWKLHLMNGRRGGAARQPAGPARSVDEYVDDLNARKRDMQRELYRRLAAL